VSTDNLNVADLTREELEQEYQLSQWALSWAVRKLGGLLIITTPDTQEYAVAGRVLYEQKPAAEGPVIVVTFKELEELPEPLEELFVPESSKIILLS